MSAPSGVAVGHAPVYPVVTDDTAPGERPAAVDERDILAGEAPVVDVVVFHDAIRCMVDEQAAPAMV